MSERDVGYARTGFLLAGLKDAPDYHAPYFPPLERDAWATLPASYRAIVPWEWSGDVAALRDLALASGELLEPSPAHAERVWVDAGYVAQLKVCGYSAAHWGGCPRGRDDALHTFERTIQENRRRTWDAVGALLDGVAAVASFVPVIGQAIAVVLAAAAAVATRRPVGGALVDMVVSAVPGGAAVRTAVVPAAAFGKAILEGAGIDDGAIAAARAFAVEVGGERAGDAFDLVLAIARGRDLQEAGFGIAFRWFPGTSAPDRAARFGLRMAQAAGRGESLERVMVSEVRGELAQIGPIASMTREVDAATRALIAEPRRFVGSFEAFASVLGVPREIARAAFMAVKPDGEGRLVESAVFRSLLIDPSRLIAGEARRTATVERWMAPKLERAAWTATAATLSPIARSSAIAKAMRPAEWIGLEEEGETAPAPALERAPTSGGRGATNVVAGILGVGGLAALGLVLATGKGKR